MASVMKRIRRNVRRQLMDRAGLKDFTEGEVKKFIAAFVRGLRALNRGT